MQKIINILAIATFGVSAAVVGGSAYLYLNKDSLIESAREKATAAVTEAITDALPGVISGAMPKMPSATGGVSTSMPAIPGL